MSNRHKHERQDCQTGSAPVTEVDCAASIDIRSARRSAPQTPLRIGREASRTPIESRPRNDRVRHRTLRTESPVAARLRALLLSSWPYRRRLTRSNSAGGAKRCSRGKECRAASNRLHHNSPRSPRRAFSRNHIQPCPAQRWPAKLILAVPAAAQVHPLFLARVLALRLLHALFWLLVFLVVLLAIVPFSHSSYLLL
jgi:hypothetical protein